MKKIYFILSAAMMFFAINANAQFGVGVGYNLLNNITRIGGESDDESLNGFFIEGTYDLNLLEAKWGSLGLQPGVRYTFGGETDTEETAGIKSKASLTEHYLDIPVNVKYSYEILPSKLKAYAFAGPVFSFGLASTLSASIEDNVIKTNNYEDSEYGRFDLKLGIGAGVTLAEKLNVKLGYNIGMLNRYTGEQLSKEHKFSTHTGVFFIGVGFNF
jgi:opacity protein-like surface antigen